MKSRNLKLIFRIQGRQRFRQRYAGMSMAELLTSSLDIDLSSVRNAAALPCSSWGGVMLLPHKRTFFSYRFLGLPLEVCETCPAIRLPPGIIGFSRFSYGIRTFSALRKDPIPISDLADRPRIGTIERINTRSRVGLLFFRSESDTFLMNYRIPHIPVRVKESVWCCKDSVHVS